MNGDDEEKRFINIKFRALQFAFLQNVFFFLAFFTESM